MENLYLTGLARKDIWSMRELRQDHLLLLKKMACKGKVRNRKWPCLYAMYNKATMAAYAMHVVHVDLCTVVCRR